jgi:ferredoxin-NADP reductase
VIYSRPAPADILGQDFDRSGHLSLQLLEGIGIPQDADFYLCGPPGFLQDLQNGRAAWGVPWPKVHVELFGSTPTLTPGISGVAATRPHRADGPAGGDPW